MFSLAPAVPIAEKSATFSFGRKESSFISPVNHCPKSILKQSPLTKTESLSRSKPKVSINLPDNEISLANKFPGSMEDKTPSLSKTTNEKRNLLKVAIDMRGREKLTSTALDHLDEHWRMRQINAITKSVDCPHILVGVLNSLERSDYSPERWTDIVEMCREPANMAQESTIS